MTTEDKSQMPLFSPEDEKEAHKVPDHSPKKGTLKATHKWTGFRGKTLWDWLDLLAKITIPLVVVGATILFGMQQVNLSNQQHEADRLRALDQQRQTTLVTYLDNMRDLLLNKGLLTSKPDDEIRVIARTETLSAMRQLDGKRNSFLLQFLQDAQLIGFIGSNIVSFKSADMSSIDLSGANLENADLRDAHLNDTNLTDANLTDAQLNAAHLSGANLTNANLSGADLSDADLRGAILHNAHLLANFTGALFNKADLSDAKLFGAQLNAANLSGANLSGADLSDASFNDPLNVATINPAHLSDANLSGTNFSGADLSDTNLQKTNLTQQQLDQVLTCKGAILPKGLTCHHNQ